MNYGDKTRSVTIRLTPEQYAFLEKARLPWKSPPPVFSVW